MITTNLLIKEAKSRGWQAELIDDRTSVIIMKAPQIEEPIMMWSDFTELSSSASMLIAEYKHVTLIFAEKLNVPMPEYVIYESKQQAEEFLHKYKRVIVKPSKANHGDGITTDITDTAKLADAIIKASDFGDIVLIQKQYSGDDHRILVVGDRVVAAAKRRPPQVVGDGIKTISELISEKNSDPKRGQSHDSPLTLINVSEVANFIGQERLNEVLKADEIIQLLGTANLSKGGEAIDVTDQLHPELADAVVKLSQAVGLGVSGVDFLVSDCSKPLSQSDAVLLEVNVAPGLRMHHFPSIGTPRNAAGAILDEIVKKRTKNQENT